MHPEVSTGVSRVCLKVLRVPRGIQSFLDVSRTI